MSDRLRIVLNFVIKFIIRLLQPCFGCLFLLTTEPGTVHGAVPGFRGSGLTGEVYYISGLWMAFLLIFALPLYGFAGSGSHFAVLTSSVRTVLP
mgnify:CR=1 FL=1